MAVRTTVSPGLRSFTKPISLTMVKATMEPKRIINTDDGPRPLRFVVILISSEGMLHKITMPTNPVKIGFCAVNDSFYHFLSSFGKPLFL